MVEERLQRGETVFYARIFPSVGIFDVCELRVRTVEENWFSGEEKTTKITYIFKYSDINEIVFKDRDTALNMVLDAETNNKSKIFTEKDTDIYL